MPVKGNSNDGATTSKFIALSAALAVFTGCVCDGRNPQDAISGICWTPDKERLLDAMDVGYSHFMEDDLSAFSRAYSGADKVLECIISEPLIVNDDNKLNLSFGLISQPMIYGARSLGAINVAVRYVGKGYLRMSPCVIDDNGKALFHKGPKWHYHYSDGSIISWRDMIVWGGNESAKDGSVYIRIPEGEINKNIFNEFIRQGLIPE